MPVGIFSWMTVKNMGSEFLIDQSYNIYGTSLKFRKRTEKKLIRTRY